MHAKFVTNNLLYYKYLQYSVHCLFLPGTGTDYFFTAGTSMKTFFRPASRAVRLKKPCFSSLPAKLSKNCFSKILSVSLILKFSLMQINHFRHQCRLQMKIVCDKLYTYFHGELAQLARAVGSQSTGHGFESHILHI